MSLMSDFINENAGLDLREYDFTNANLRNKNFKGADLEYAILVNADLEGSNLEGVNLKQADLSGAKMRFVWVIIPISVEITGKKPPLNYCGIDPGVKTFMTSFGNNGCIEYKHNEITLQKLDKKISYLTDSRRTNRKRVTKKKINRIETRKANLIDELHWKTINRLLKVNDFIFYGDIKSHDIVKNGKNRTLNTDMNNLKFFKFKQRLLFKAIERGKKVYETKEHYTTQTCSFCGSMYKPGLSRVYRCKNCKKSVGRDVNAAKNILMKGIVAHLY